jgi:hypothetical protein
MWPLKPKEYNPNRRRAFRIYEQANLNYQKVQQQNNWESTSTQPSLLEQSLPNSRSQDNATLKVNISNSGIAFTCVESLQAGDYLIVRLLLLPSMTEIISSCKVVYCSTSNPFEKDRYAYTIGATFINLTKNDKEVLHQHIERRRKQQWTINSLIAAIVAFVLIAPEQAWELMLSLSHHLLETTLHLLHLGFEYLEMGLDHVIEHTFHTGMRETQIIVFYIIVSLALPLLYFMTRRLCRACLRWYQAFLLYCWRKYSSCLYFWDSQTPMEKLRWISISTLLVTGYIYLGV